MFNMEILVYIQGIPTPFLRAGCDNELESHPVPVYISFRFVGPTGLKMLVNCLPLYEPPPDTATSSQPSPTPSPVPIKKRTKSEEVLATPNKTEFTEDQKQKSSEAEDINSKSDGKPISGRTRFNSSFTANYSTRIRDTPTSPTPVTEENSAESQTSKSEEEKLSTSVNDEEKVVEQKIEEGKKEEADAGEIEHTKTSSKDEESPGEMKPSKDTPKEKVTPSPDAGSDQEETSLQVEVKYLENTDELNPQLKRSSGSVSFISGVAVAPFLRAVSPPPDEPSISEGEIGQEEDITSEVPTQAGSETNGETSVASTEATPEKPQEPSLSDSKPGAEVGKVEATATSEKPQEPSLPDSKPGAEVGKVEAAATSEQQQTKSSEKPPLLAEANKQLTQPSAAPSAPPTQNLLIPTPLPTPPTTMTPGYIERSGWLSKLSHRKGQ